LEEIAGFQLLVILFGIGVFIGAFGSRCFVTWFEPQDLVGNKVLDGTDPLGVHTNI
jgi:hypothetical protein